MMSKSKGKCDGPWSLDRQFGGADALRASNHASIARQPGECSRACGMSPGPAFEGGLAQFRDTPRGTETRFAPEIETARRAETVRHHAGRRWTLTAFFFLFEKQNGMLGELRTRPNAAVDTRPIFRVRIERGARGGDAMNNLGASSATVSLCELPPSRIPAGNKIRRAGAKTRRGAVNRIRGGARNGFSFTSFMHQVMALISGGQYGYNRLGKPPAGATGAMIRPAWLERQARGRIRAAENGRGWVWAGQS